MTYPLDSATVVTASNDGTLSAPNAPDWWNATSAFGGWGLALALEAVTSQHSDLPALASATAQFYRPLKAESFAIDVREIRKGRRAAFFRVELREQDERASLALAVDFTFSDMRESELSYARPYPEVRAPEDGTVLPGGGMAPKWLQHYDQRIAAGQPFTAQDHPRSAIWVGDQSARPWDAKSILAASDTPMPRTFFVDPMPRFSSTVTYMFQMFAAAEQIAALGTELLLVEAQGEAVMHGRSAQSAYLWGPGETLIATSNQMAFY